MGRTGNQIADLQEQVIELNRLLQRVITTTQKEITRLESEFREMISQHLDRFEHPLRDDPRDY